MATLQRSSWGGENPISVIAVGCDTTFFVNIAKRCVRGESWLH